MPQRRNEATMNVRVRTFTMRDYQKVISLWRRSGVNVRLGDSPSDIKIKIGRDPNLFLVAETEGRIIGSAMGTWDGRRGWISHLGVLPAFQRRGVATMLVREVEKRMRKKGVLKVNAHIYSRNKKSLHFFRKMDYEADRTMILHGKVLAAGSE